MKKIITLTNLIFSLLVFGQVTYTHNIKTSKITRIEGSQKYSKIIIKDIDTKVVEKTEVQNTQIYFNMDDMDIDKKYIITIYFENKNQPKKFFYKVAYAYSKEESPKNVNRDFVSFANDLNDVANFYSANKEISDPAKFVIYDKKQRKEIIFSK